MKQSFTISHRGKALATRTANTPADALKAYSETHNLGLVIIPLRKENPTRVFTENGKADYIAEQWSGEILGIAGRFYLIN